MARKRSEDRVPIDWHTKNATYKRCGGVCAHCGKKLEFKQATIEHVIPLAKGGKNKAENFVILCEDCNKAKSDDIIPPKEYYPYLSKQHQEDLDRLFKDYISSDDYLDMDNLFVVDWFDLKVQRPLMLKNNKIMFMPMTMHVKKLRPEATFENLQMFTGRLTYEDKTLMAVSPERLTGSWYELTSNGKLVMTFNPYLADGTNDTAAIMGPWPYILCLDYYINPELDLKGRLVEPTLYEIMDALIGKLVDSIMSGGRGQCIMVRLRCPASGKYVDTVCSAYATILGPAADIFDVEFHDDALPGNKVRHIQYIQFAGSHSELRKFMNSRTGDQNKGLTPDEDKSKLQEQLVERLKNTPKVNKKSRSH